MRRRLFAFTSLVSLLLCVATALAWATDQGRPRWYNLGSGAGFGFTHGTLLAFGRWHQTASMTITRTCYLDVSAPLALILLAVLPLVWLLARDWRSAFPKPFNGFCPRCGYDLRASPERCPECGTAVRQNQGIAV